MALCLSAQPNDSQPPPRYGSLSLSSITAEQFVATPYNDPHLGLATPHPPKNKIHIVKPRQNVKRISRGVFYPMVLTGQLKWRGRTPCRRSLGCWNLRASPAQRRRGSQCHLLRERHFTLQISSPMSSKRKKNSHQFPPHLLDQHPVLPIFKRGPEQYEMTPQIYENSPKPSQILSFPLFTVLAFVNNTSHNIPLQSRQPCHLYAANFQSPAFNYSAVYYRLNESRASIPTLLTVLSLKNLHELKDNKL
jgi:hypothetical protein